jgi:hypothetical protein
MKPAKKPPAPPADLPAGLEEFEDTGDGLSAVLEQLGEGQGIVKIDRLRPDGRRPEFVAEVSAHEFSLAEIQQRFGGGEFVVTVLDSARKYRGRKTVSIAQPVASASPAPAAQAAPQQQPLERIFEKLAEQQQQLLATLAQRPQVDEATVRARVLEELRAFREVSGAASPIGPDKILDVLKTGVELARANAGGGDAAGWPDIVIKAIETLGPQVAELLSALKDRHAPASPRPAMGASVPPVPAAPALSQGGDMNATQETQLLRQYLPTLIALAADNRDPALYADLILDQVPEPILRRYLEGDLVSRLATIDARVRQHAEWFRDLGAAVKEGFAPDAAQPGNASAPDGAAPHDPIG